MLLSVSSRRHNTNQDKDSSPFGSNFVEMASKLEKVFKLRGYLKSKGTIDIGPHKGEHDPRHIVIPTPLGYLDGSGLRAELLPGFGDWQTVHTSLFRYKPVVLYL